MFKNQIKFIKKKDTLNSTYDEGKSVIAERFINTLKAKIYKKMTANGWGILHWLRNLRQIIKFLILKVNIGSQLLSIWIFLIIVTLKIGQKKYLLSILIWKLILGYIKLNI